MKKLIVFAIIILFGTVNVQAQAIKRVPKNDKKDSSKTESIVKKDNNASETKEPPKQDSFRSQRKDEFIDKNGDGINDQMTQSKPPAVKKQPPPPPQKAPEIKPQPEPQKQPPPPPKSKNEEKESKSSEKKSRR